MVKSPPNAAEITTSYTAPLLYFQLLCTEENYKHCQCYPIYGMGQGSGNSLTIWLVISFVLFNCYEEKAFGADPVLWMIPLVMSTNAFPRLPRK
jgi:hypothetical protein